MAEKTKRKIRVGIIFGGKSAEHEVSVESARNVANALNKNKYEVSLIGIDKNGGWHSMEKLALPPAGKQDLPSLNLSLENRGEVIDVIFPVLHGPFGEDGTVQGLLKLAGIPFVGAGILGSALGMDKDAMKRLLRDAGIKTARFMVFNDPSEIKIGKIKKEFGWPVFVKPANLGSSVGVAKAKNEKEFRRAVKNAFRFDRKILVEEYVRGREIECSVLGNENQIASIPGEIVPQRDFYSYEAKYLDENGAILKVPADLPPQTIKKIQETAVKAFQTLCCEGMARVDFFLMEKGEIIVNEINTIPGFTKISMYPKLWEASGMSHSRLIDTLIKLALDRFKKEKKLETSVNIKEMKKKLSKVGNKI